VLLAVVVKENLARCFGMFQFLRPGVDYLVIGPVELDRHRGGIESTSEMKSTVRRLKE